MRFLFWRKEKSKKNDLNAAKVLSGSIGSNSGLPSEMRGSLAAEEESFPTYKGKDIFEWLPEIATLKRQQKYDEALSLARGCMNSMVEAARVDHRNVLEKYVIEVVIIQHKIKDYKGCIETIESWLSLDLPASREDHRIDLKKRLAKSKELLAKQEGRDHSSYSQEWRYYLELSKEAKNVSNNSSDSSGRSRVVGVTYGTSGGRTQKYIPSKSILRSNSFVAVDFETANSISGVSACQIALVKVVNGHIVETFNSLIKPPDEFDFFEFTHLHGISQRKVRKSPSWGEISEKVSNFVDGSPVYAHNASFDARVWRELDNYFSVRTCPEQVYCTYRMSRNMIPGLPDYKLPTVLSRCAPKYKLKHHKADSDAVGCSLIVKYLSEIV